MDWKARVRASLALAPTPLDEDVIDELAQHAQATYETARAGGCSPAEADEQVVEQLNAWQRNSDGLHRRGRDTAPIEPPSQPSSYLAGIGQDLRYAVRLSTRQPRHALLAVLTMALGIGATTVLFSVTYGVLIKPLPWPAGDRLVVLKETRGGHPPRFNSFTNAAYVAWREESRTIEGIAAWSQRTLTLTGAGEPDRVRMTTASASLFTVLGVTPMIGRVFTEGDESSKVIVLSEGLWKQRFGGDHSALDRVVQLDGEPYRIIGVLSDAAAFPNREARAWVPYRVLPVVNNSLSTFEAVATLKPGVTAAQAAAEATARGRFAPDSGLATMAIFGGGGEVAISATPFQDALAADVRQPIVVLLVAAGLLLATAIANVAGLQLAHGTTRRRELGIRSALGANSRRLARQLLVESLLLGVTGGAAGLALAWSLHRVMPSLLPVDFPRGDDLALNAAVVLFAIVVTALASLACGLAPVLRARKLHPVQSLAEDGSAVGMGRSRTAEVRMLMMAGQVAIACVLLIAASLLTRSFIAMLDADRGYDPSGVLIARLPLPAAMYPADRRHAVLSQILDTLSTMPQVSRAAFTSESPITPGGSTSAFTMRSPTADGGTVSVQASPRIVSEHYFAAIGMRIVQGRGFTDADTDATAPAIVVSRTFARRYLGDAAIGARLPFGLGYQSPTTEGTVVGVVDDVRYVAPVSTSRPEMYFSFRQMKGRVAVSTVTLTLRTAVAPATLIGALRAAVRDADRGLVPEAIASMDDRVWTSLARPRLYAVLLGGFATFALVIVGVGLFGVLSSLVAQRSRELAVRTALGARQADIVGLVLRQSLAVTGAGLAAGLVGSFLLVGSLSALLYGIDPHDALTYIVVPLIVIGVGLIACVAPAARAARIDPLRALRS